MFDAQSTSMVVSGREEEQEEGEQQRHQLTLLCSIFLVGINLCGTYYDFKIRIFFVKNASQDQKQQQNKKETQKNRCYSQKTSPTKFGRQQSSRR